MIYKRLIEIVEDKTNCVEFVNNGNASRLLSIDMEKLIAEFNRGNYEILNNPEFSQLFLTNYNITASYVTNILLYLESKMYLKDEVLRDIQTLKDRMQYSPNNTYKTVDGKDYSFADILKTIKKAEAFTKNKNTIRLIHFLLKYESVIEDIRERKRILDIMANEKERSEEFARILHSTDEELGIIVYTNGAIYKNPWCQKKDPTKVVAGTKQDILLSELIETPFARDCHKVFNKGMFEEYLLIISKEFYDTPVTPLHFELLCREREKRDRLKEETSDEMGYIMTKDAAVIISRKELTSRGLDLKILKWKPIKLTIKPKTFKEVFNEYSWRKRRSLQKRLTLQKKN